MKIDEIKTGILVFVSSLIEEEIDGIKRRRGALGMIDSPVFGTGGLWWWVVHQDGAQIKYRYCEISEMRTIKVSGNETPVGVREGLREAPISDDIAASKTEAEEKGEDNKEENREVGSLRELTYEIIEKWID